MGYSVSRCNAKLIAAWCGGYHERERVRALPAVGLAFTCISKLRALPSPDGVRAAAGLPYD